MTSVTIASLASLRFSKLWKGKPPLRCRRCRAVRDGSLAPCMAVAPFDPRDMEHRVSWLVRAAGKELPRDLLTLLGVPLPQIRIVRTPEEGDRA